MIIVSDLTISIGIAIHGADMNIHWDNATITWRDIYSKTSYVFAILQYNASFNYETKRMKRILDAKYTKPILRPSQKSPLILILKKETSYTHY